VHDSTDQAGGQYDGFPVTDKIDMHYRAFNFSQEDNFCRIDVDRDAATLRVRVFGRKGEQLLLASGTPLDATLQLAAW
jgi:alkaline phosphatase D